jgi:hypothetical protein
VFGEQARAVAAVTRPGAGIGVHDETGVLTVALVFVAAERT